MEVILEVSYITQFDNSVDTSFAAPHKWNESLCPIGSAKLFAETSLFGSPGGPLRSYIRVNCLGVRPLNFISRVGRLGTRESLVFADEVAKIGS